MTKTGKSYFGRYFRYKVGRNKPMIIIFALFNVLTAIILPHFLLIISSNYYTELNPDNTYELVAIQSFREEIKPMMFAAVIGAIMITVTTIKVMNVYHDRAAMDTLCSLPLTYRERFWGDMLSSMFINFVSFIPSFIISAIIEYNSMIAIKEELERNEPDYLITVISHSLMVFLIVVFISYIGVYAVTAFIKSCCGRFSTAVIFSFVAMAVVPGIYAVYANYFYSFTIGIELSSEVCSIMGLLPPFGFIFSLAMRGLDPFLSVKEANSVDYLLNRPVCIIVPVLIIAAFFLGAYYIGKKRKAEKTGEGFVFNSAFHALDMLLLVMMLGLGSTYFFGEKGTVGVLIVILITFFFFAALEVAQKKGFKGFWKTAVRYAAVFGGCFAFLTVIRSTNAFEYYKRLPKEENIAEVRISGDYFFSLYAYTDRAHTYKDPESIAVILNEHKKLLETDDLVTGYQLEITYVTKSGREISRGYSGRNGDIVIRPFSDAINELTEYDESVLGIIAGSDFGNIQATFHNKNDNGMPSGEIRKDKTEELAKILLGDIKNNYIHDSIKDHSVGTVTFLNVRNGGSSILDYYQVLDTYEATLEFLNDTDNYENYTEKAEVEYYHVEYHTDDPEVTVSDISVTVSTDDTSEYAKELLSYIIVGIHSPYAASQCFTIYDNNNNDNYAIGRVNEQAAVKAMLGLIRENNAG